MTKTLTALALGLALAASCALAAPAAAAIPEAAGVPSLAPMLNEVTPGVVNIAVRSRAPEASDNPLFNDPFFRRFFNAPRQRERRVQATGSGVIVDAAQGYVLTNNHVVDKAETIEVTTKDNRHFAAKLVGRDDETDIAVLKIEGGNLKAVPLGDSDRLQVGDFVVAIGNPFGLGQTVTSGIVTRWSISRAGWSASTPPSWRPAAAISASASRCRSTWRATPWIRSSAPARSSAAASASPSRI